MTTCAALELDHVSVAGFIEMRPEAHREATQAIARAAGSAQDAKVYSLLARRAAEIDIEAEFDALAEEAQEWTDFTFDAVVESWPND